MSLSPRVIQAIIEYCQKQNYKLFTNPGEYNILYIEGMDTEGELNNDSPNQFNDVRVVLNHNFQFCGNWSATTEPGRFYTLNPMNKKGAARIAFGQFKAWAVGVHGNSEPHRALVQVGPVKVFRDANKDGLRTGDAIDEGLFGINQHWGYDLPLEDQGKASAGCLVGRTRQGHQQFMNIITGDIRYHRDRSFLFSSIIIPGDKLKL